LRAAVYVLRFGMAKLTQAIAEGQYAHPNGIFYGGAAPEEGTARYRDWVAARLAGIEHGLAIDVHTGLGRGGHEGLFLAGSTAAAMELARALDAPVRADGGDSVGYAVRGGYANAFARLPVCVLTQELGTYPPVRVLHALREENRAHHYSPANAERAK